MKFISYGKSSGDSEEVVGWLLTIITCFYPEDVKLFSKSVSLKTKPSI